MELLVKRFHSGSESTLGALFVNGRFNCFTCEDIHRKIKVPGKTRIPAGRFQIKLRAAGGMHKRASIHSWHRGMLWLQDVPNFSWIYIHIGNTHENTRGCLLVGAAAYSAKTQGGWLERSGLAYRELYGEVIEAMDRGEEVWITIEDAL